MAQKIIQNYQQAVSYLKSTIPKKKDRYPGNLGLDRQFQILKLLDNPQNKIKVVHIAGTSGKGSTAFYLSSLLISQGFKIGLTVSPHLLDVRERFQINNKLISKKEFIDYLNQIIPVVDQIKNSHFGQPTFFEILIALAFLIFYKEGVDYTVVETGLGGLMDGTNVISSPDKIAVITKIGLDHTSVLGPNLISIARQKAGIIHSKNPVFSIHQHPNVQKILNQSVSQKDTSINYLSKNNFKNINIKDNFVSYDFSFNNLKISTISLNTIGLYQVENSAISLAVLNFLSLRDHFKLDISKIKNTLSNLNFFGRASIFKIKKTSIILDGAHNYQKMKAFTFSLKKFYPQQKFTFILAFKTRKDFSKMVRLIVPLADKIILTNFKVKFQDMIQISQPVSSIVNFFKKINFSNYEIIADSSDALKTATNLKNPIVVTGSLYLLPKIYSHLSDLNSQ